MSIQGNPVRNSFGKKPPWFYCNSSMKILVIHTATFLERKPGNVMCTVVRRWLRWSCGRASGFQSKGPGLETTCCRFKTWAISFTPLCPCLSEDTLKAFGPFCLVSMPGEVKDPTQGNKKTIVVDSVSLITLVISNSKLTILPHGLGMISCKGFGVISCKSLVVISCKALGVISCIGNI